MLAQEKEERRKAAQEARSKINSQMVKRQAELEDERKRNEERQAAIEEAKQRKASLARSVERPPKASEVAARP